jgi:pre-mRNA-splicing factor RBM22/SLT11
MYSSQRDEDSGAAEAKEFPILCETCLGDNPYVRMTREPHGKACKICERPFTVFRWRPGSDARYKKTEVCPTCAKLKNVCQTCILDLQYGLPVQVRDSVLAEHERVNLAAEDVNRGFQIEQLEKSLENGSAALPYGKIAPSALLQRLARKQPYYKRNQAHICSFFVRGECDRGSTCPYRHEMPVGGELAHQNIKDRFNGTNDPVANKMLGRMSNPSGSSSVPPPIDESITTLWVGGLDDSVTELELRDKFYSFGAIAAIRIVGSKQCAFVTFSNRKGAEDAAAGLKGSLAVRGLRLRVDWGKSAESTVAARSKRAPPGLSVTAESANQTTNINFNLDAIILAPPPGMDSLSYYPSMDSRQMAAKMNAGDQ